jgi:hypothetical protein
MKNEMKKEEKLPNWFIFACILLIILSVVVVSFLVSSANSYNKNSCYDEFKDNESLSWRCADKACAEFNLSASNSQSLYKYDVYCDTKHGTRLSLDVVNSDWTECKKWTDKQIDLHNCRVKRGEATPNLT